MTINKDTVYKTAKMIVKSVFRGVKTKTGKVLGGEYIVYIEKEKLKYDLYEKMQKDIISSKIALVVNFPLLLRCAFLSSSIHLHLLF